MQKRVAIIGGGASGLVSAIIIARAFGKSVDIEILERCDRVGRKLLATGNGRCNITNANIQIANYHSVDSGCASAIESILRRFDNDSAMRFFEDLGAEFLELEGGKIFPSSLQASSILDLLRLEARRLGVKEILNCNVTGIKPIDGAGEHRETLDKAGGYRKFRDNAGESRKRMGSAGEYRETSRGSGGYRIQIEGSDSKIADCVLVAAGGEASPQLGSNGSGYKLLEAFGHKSTRRYAAIVPLETDTSQIKALRGIKFVGEADIIRGGKTLRSDFGEILFTEYGLSGPPILQLSAALIDSGFDAANQDSWIILRLFPEKEKEVILSKLFLRRAALSHFKLEDFFLGWLNKRIGQSLFRVCGISDLQRLSGSLTDGEIVSLCEMMVAWPIRIEGARPFSQAQVTAGGFSLNEFSAGLESRFSPGLFAAGEILDVHGDCGGYNLQWAWSSAHTAALAMIKRLKKT